MSARVTSMRIVGRATELAELEAARAGAAAGRPSLTLICGESGVGKSRLLAELADRAGADDDLVLAGDCVELGEGELPYAPLVAALRPLGRSEHPALVELPDSQRAELGRLIPGLATPGPPSDESDPAAQGRLFEALLALLDRLGADAPVLLAIEDLHWADRSTRAFLAFLSRSLTRERVLLVATYRSDELHRRHPLRPLLAELERDPRVRRIDLGPLDRAEVAEALADILGAEPAPELLDRLYARCEGNPLYMEELLAAGADGRGALPPTLRDALMLRIERLGEPAQELLRLLAVGQRLDHGLLADASGLDAATLRGALRETVAAHLLVVHSDGGHGFRHALLGEVVADDLLPGESAELHLALARAGERRAAEVGGGAHLTAGIAHHFLAAGDHPAALAASVRAAEAAEDVHAYGEAAALYERALELWDRVPDAERLAGRDRVALLERAAGAHMYGGDLTRQETLLRAALAELGPDVPANRVAGIMHRLARAQHTLNRTGDALETARGALELLDDGPSRERAALLGFMAKARMLQGRYREAVRLARQASAVADQAGHPPSHAQALDALGVSLIVLGEADEGVAALREAVAILDAAGWPGAMTTAYVNLADTLNLVGRSDEALVVVGEALEHSQPGFSRDCALSAMAIISFDRGEWSAVEPNLPPPDRRLVGTDLLCAAIVRSELALGRGDHATARAQLAAAEEVARQSTEPQYIGPYGALLAELRRREGDLDGARRAIDEALDRIEFCTEDVMRLARVTAKGVTVEADRALRACDLGEAAECDQALARAADLLARTEAAAQDGGPVEAAWQATSEAELARGNGRAEPERWARAAEAWEAVSRPYQRALARWREAEAHLGREDRPAAERAARGALELAREIGAGWLTGEVEALAARGRLRLEPDGEPAATAAPASDEPFGLTPRERQVLALLARGATNREIGGALYMAEKTASVHVSRILGKLDVRTRTQAAAVAHRLGLADDPSLLA